LPERELLVLWIGEATSRGARIRPACETADISLRTYRRWFLAGVVSADQRPLAVHPTPKNKLSVEEVAAILLVCNEPKYASVPPSQIVPRLADEGVYLASESTFYRILKGHNQLTHRGRAKERRVIKRPITHIATAPKQLWSWDITYLASFVKGRFYYLYLFEDVFSRKIVGYELYEQESGELAADLLQRTLLQEQCINSPIVLHSDNGAPMRSYTFKAKMEELGVISSYSRPRVSNDNPFSESLFRTLKYCPMWPSEGFRSLDAARIWVAAFAEWYNNTHRHSKIGFVTPDQKHRGEDLILLHNRKELYEAFKQKNPLRWTGAIRNWDTINAVSLNPEKQDVIKQLLVA
jgi:putative transposase